jgi:hypothetical protein
VSFISETGVAFGGMAPGSGPAAVQSEIPDAVRIAAGSKALSGWLLRGLSGFFSRVPLATLPRDYLAHLIAPALARRQDSRSVAVPHCGMDVEAAFRVPRAKALNVALLGFSQLL